MVSPAYLQKFRDKWNHIIATNTSEKLKKVHTLDGKTQGGTASKQQKANHRASAVDNNGFCIDEVLVNDRSNKITAIPEFLKQLNVKDTIITTDAMGCQKDIVKLIRHNKVDYMLNLKRNQGSL